MKSQYVIAALAVFSVSTLLADFSYEESARITGGVAAAGMKVAAVFSKQAREPMKSFIAVKGDRMAHLSSTHGSIIDLSKETITNIDFQKKTWSVMTFAEMQQAMEQVAQKMKEKPKEKPKENPKENQNSADVKYKISVDSTGQTKDINGLTAKEMILKMEMEATDTQSGQSGSMVVTMDTWLVAKVPGYEEVVDFHRRMAQKMKWTPGQMPMARPEMSKGMAEISQEASKLDGMPVYSTIRMGGPGMQAQAAPPGAQPAEQPKQQGPSAGSVLGGALGGRFGLGRKKPQPQEQQSPSGSQPPAQGDPAGLLMEMVNESGNFSSAPVDPAKFEVPAGFKQVDARNSAR